MVLDGKTPPSPVTSGAPQGTVLGPLLYLIYINDLPSRVSSTARLFADDCLLYRVISNQEDAASLQEDLDHLQEWERDWQMNLNPDKCEHIRISNKRKIIQTTYKIHGQVLKETSKAKNLGVTIDKTLSWNSHIDMVTKKGQPDYLLSTEKPVIMSKGYKRSQLQDTCKTSARECGYSLGPIYKDRHQQGRSCPETRSKILPQ